MRISQNPDGDRTYRYLLSESEIQEFVEGLRMNHSAAVTQRLNATLLAITEIIQNRLDDSPNETPLLIIKKIAREYKNKQYQRLMQVIIDALEPGKERLSAAFFTITRVTEMLHSSSPDQSSPTKFYEEMMKEIKEQEGEK